MCILIVSHRLLEVFSWLVEVDNITKENRDNGKIIWSITYVQEGGRSQNFSTEMMTNIQADGKKQKIIARFQIMKDDIQAILPIAKVNKSSKYGFDFIIVKWQLKCVLIFFRIGN